MPRKSSKKARKQAAKRDRLKNNKMREKQSSKKGKASRGESNTDSERERQHEVCGPVKPVGLTNLGNTCFMNSMLQNLTRIAPLRDYFLSPAPPGEGPLTSGLREVFVAQWRPENEKSSDSKKSFSDRFSSFSPTALFAEVGKINPRFKGRQQQDAAELLTTLITSVIEEEKNRLTKSYRASRQTIEVEESSYSSDDQGTRDSNAEDEDICKRKQEIKVPPSELVTVFERHLGGYSTSVIKCLECGGRSGVLEAFNDVLLAMKPRTEPDNSPGPCKEEEQTISKAKKKLRGKNGSNRKAKGKAAKGKKEADANITETSTISDSPSSENDGSDTASNRQVILLPAPSSVAASTSAPPPAPPMPPPPLPARATLPLTNSTGFIGPALPPHLQPTSLSETETDESSLPPVTSLFDDTDDEPSQPEPPLSFEEQLQQGRSSLTSRQPDQLTTDFDNPFNEAPNVPDDALNSIPPQPSSDCEAGLQDASDNDSYTPPFNIFSDNDDSAEDENKYAPNTTEASASTAKKPSSTPQFKVSQVGNAIMSMFAPSKAPYGYENLSGCFDEYIIAERLDGDEYKCEKCHRAEKLRLAMSRAMNRKLIAKKSEAAADRKVVIVEKDPDSPTNLEQCAKAEFGASDVNLVKKVDANGVSRTEKLEINNKQSVLTASSPITTSESSVAGSDDEDIEHRERGHVPCVRKNDTKENRGMTREEEDALIEKMLRENEVPKVNCRAEKQIMFYDFSDVLVVQLKRFYQPLFGGRMRKISGHVDFPIELDLAAVIDREPLTEDIQDRTEDDPRGNNQRRNSDRQAMKEGRKSAAKPETKFVLTGISVHMGTMNGGHYVAYVRGKLDKDDRGDWYYCSDSSVRKATEKEVLDSEAYVLFYEKVSA